ncbi:MAG: TMEM165/GDT1 family protein, partial [Nocardioidaceae bacterium]
MDWHLLLLSFALIFPVELPDKTFVAALVLSTRYRPLAVWIGVGLAFGVQCLVAVTAGQAVSYLPDWVVHVVSTAMFLVGAIILFRAAPRADAEEREQEAE